MKTESETWLVSFIHPRDEGCGGRFDQAVYFAVAARSKQEVRSVIDQPGFWRSGVVPKCGGEDGCGRQFVTEIDGATRACDGKGGQPMIVKVDK